MDTRRGLGALCALVLSLVALSAPASAQITQPDGTPIPCTACSNSLQSYFDMRSEGINAVTEAAIEPEQFVPGCTIHFTVVVRDTGYSNSFGWYNIQSGRAPTAGELFELVPAAPANDPTYGAGFTASLSVRTDPRYTGGNIGFYLTNGVGQTFYSERAYQPDADVTGGRIHVLIYNSHVTPQAFYFAWEDLFGGGDNDFQDLLMIVDNLVCAGGGAPCDTGMPGACSAGLQQCRSGGMTCVPISSPSPERCDGEDNDCNGMIDDGPGLCPNTEICDRGQCVERCVELACPDGQTCSPRGTCVEISCSNVDCPAGQRCVGGQCVDACSAVTCPHGEVCRVGRCVDPCASLTCDGESVCVAGVCQPRCPCRPCAAGETCEASGQCVEDACMAVSCAPGTFCQAGQCVDACQGTVCPSGQACQGGECVDIPPGADAGSGGDGGNTGGDGGRMDAGRSDAGRSDAALMDGASADGTNADGSARSDAGTTHRLDGCGCRAAGATNERSASLSAFGMLGAVLLLARRRRRSTTTFERGNHRA